MSKAPSVNVVDGQVVPRSAAGTGTVTARGPASLEVVAADGQAWSATGDGLVSMQIPAGGPYRVVATSGDARRVVSELYVGDVWVLAGQSNMQGCAPPAPVTGRPDRVQVRGFDGLWRPAVEPLHRLYERRDHPLTRLFLALSPEGAATWDELHAADAVEPVGGQGPGGAFARSVVQATGVPVGLLPCALGGTSLDLWSPDWTSPSGTSLFDHLVDQVRCHGPVRGVLWYQGEADALEGLADYGERFARFVAAVRAAVGVPDLPFLTVELADCAVDDFPALRDRDVDQLARSWEAVREAQRSAAQLPGIEVVTATDLQCFDGVHLDAASTERLGRRLARAALPYVERPVDQRLVE